MDISVAYNAARSDGARTQVLAWFIARKGVTVRNQGNGSAVISNRHGSVTVWEDMAETAMQIAQGCFLN